MIDKVDLVLDYGFLGVIDYIVYIDVETGRFEEMAGKALYPSEEPLFKEIFQEIESHLDGEVIASNTTFEQGISTVFDFSPEGERIALFVSDLSKSGLLKNPYGEAFASINVVEEILKMSIVEGLDCRDGSLSLPKIKQAFLRRVRPFEKFEKYKEIAELYLD